MILKKKTNNSMYKNYDNCICDPLEAWENKSYCYAKNCKNIISARDRTNNSIRLLIGTFIIASFFVFYPLIHNFFILNKSISDCLCDKPHSVVVPVTFVLGGVTMTLSFVAIMDLMNKRRAIAIRLNELKEEETVNNSPKKRKRMPRIFRYSLYTILVLSLWKVYTNLEPIVIYFFNRH